MIWVEPCAGGAACALYLVGGRQCVPPVSWMGGKRYLSAAIVGAMMGERRIPDAVYLADPGPWGWVWPILRDHCHEISTLILAWHDDENDVEAFWKRLEAAPVPTHPIERVAVWCVLQRCVWRSKPVSIRGGRWKTDGFSGVGTGKGKTLSLAHQASAVRLMSALAFVPFHIHHGDATGIEVPGGEVFVYIDPPYVGTTGYGHALPRVRVLDLARRWQDAGAVVAVSEREPLELDGWHPVDLCGVVGRGGDEWLTMSRPPVVVPAIQQQLFG